MKQKVGLTISTRAKVTLWKEKMKQLLIVTHGSRREQSNNEVRVLAEKVAIDLPLITDDVLVAFLEFASPSISEAIDISFTQGVKELVVLPYFLSAGNHVTRDIPKEIDTVMRNWPDRKVTILPHIGASNVMADLIGNCCQNKNAMGVQ